MRQRLLLLVLSLPLMCAPAMAAGLKLLQLPADGEGPAISVAVWYPSAEAPQAIAFGPFTVSGARDGAVKGSGLPLVVLSHGRGGSFAEHHDTAEQLADAGFVVAALNHPGDTTLDKGRTDELSVFIERPLDVKRVIDFMTGTSPLAAAIDPSRIGFYGFSRGGYTGLVVIGANPDFARALARCEGQTARFCDEVRAGAYPKGPLTHDPRIKAAAIADPLGAILSPESVAGITVPVQLWGSELGGDGVEPASVAAIDDELKAPHTFTKIEHSGHFSFLTVCPAEFADTAPMICKDPQGFDRAAFHQRLNADLSAFFRTHL